MEKYTYNEFKKYEANNLHEFIKYKRQDPILLRFSNILFTNDINKQLKEEIENEMGKAIIIWTEIIINEDEVIDAMINLRKSGCKIQYDINTTHYMYGFFENWNLGKQDTNMKLVQNLAFYGEKDFWLKNIDKNVITVRRVYEKSYEYMKLLHNLPTLS